MSIEAGQKYIDKDGEVVEVVNLKDNFPYDLGSIYEECVWFGDNDKNMHVLTKRDFLEQYKPYEPVYEYQWAYKAMSYDDFNMSNYMTDNEAKDFIYRYKQRLDFTKRERK